MVTSDERREVAYRLRTNFVSFAKARGESGATYPLRCICALARLIGAEYTDWLTINARIADLIDPTCEDVSEVNPVDGFKCSVCGWPGVVGCADCDETVTSFDEIGEYVPIYCPNCGARVVRGDGR